MGKKKKRNLKNLPRWCFIFLIIDIILLFIMRTLGSHICGDSNICYRLDPKADRFADYFALVVAVMAIMIPVAIELWRRQFRAHNFAPQSLLDQEWDKKDRRRHLSEPVGAVAIFVVVSCVLPLFIRSTALFYAAIFYGIYLLAYVFIVSFYAKPLNIYDISGLKLSGSVLPNPELMLELTNVTLDNAKRQKSNEIAKEDDWSTQLSEDITLKKLGDWSSCALRQTDSTDVTRHQFWSLFNNFLKNCQSINVWAATTNDGILKGLFKNSAFYADLNLMYAQQTLRTVIDRFMSEDTYYDATRDLLKLIPITDLSPKNLYDLLMPTMKQLFFKADRGGEVLQDALPEEWIVTSEKLDASDVMARTMALIYLRWVSDLQRYAQEIKEGAVQDTTEVLFVGVEPMLFAKFVKLWVNMGLVVTSNASEFQKAISRWHLFGHVGGIATEWVPTAADEREFEERFARAFTEDSEHTISLVKKLGWFPKERAKLQELSDKLKVLINQGDWRDHAKQSWLTFADKIPDLAEDPEE